MTPPSPPISAPVLVDRLTLARCLNVNEHTLDVWRRQGMPGPVQGGGRGVRSQYDLLAVTRWWHARMTKPLTTKDRLNLKQIERIELELQAKRRTLLDREPVLRAITLVITDAKSAFQGLHVWLRQRHEIAPGVMVALAARVDELLTALSDGVYGAVPPRLVETNGHDAKGGDDAAAGEDGAGDAGPAREDPDAARRDRAGAPDDRAPARGRRRREGPRRGTDPRGPAGVAAPAAPDAPRPAPPGGVTA
jgi:hypothetical protein